MDLDEIVETFEALEPGEERYRYLIELGKGLEGLPEELKIEPNRVHGCQSRRWYEILGAPGRRHGNLVNDIWPQALENRREALEENSFASEVRPEILEYMQYAIRVHGILRETSR